MDLSGQQAAPDWVDLGSKASPGLDLTGLRLPVQAVSNQLLDGITTITPSVRYFSLYSWIIHSYWSARLPNSWRSFRAFANQVEAAIALGNILRNPKVTGVIGSRGALSKIEAGDDPLSLEALVKQPVVNIYSNPSVELGLTHSNDAEIPGLSLERGEPLAKLVRSELYSTRLGSLFSDGRTVEVASRSDLVEFGEPVYLPEPTPEETQLLVAAILPQEPRSDRERHRIATYACVLGLAKLLGRPPEETDFFSEVQQVSRELPEPLHPILDGWLRYSVRDVLAVFHERVLEQVIRALGESGEAGKPIPNREVVGSLVVDSDQHRDALADLKLLARDEDPLTIRFDLVFQRILSATAQKRVESAGLVRWDGKLMEWSLINSARGLGDGVLALLPVAWSIAFLRTEQWPDPRHNPFEGRRGLGWSRIGVYEVVSPAILRFRQEDWTYGEVMVELALRTIDQHLRVSWSRMAVDTKRDVALLVSEGSRWRSRSGEKHVSEYSGGRTASRLTQVANWLKQLALIEDDGLTPEGRRVLECCLATLTAGPPR